MRTDAEIQAIIDDPKYSGWTKKDFRNAKILTRKETERKGLTFQHYGKKKDPTKVRKAQTKRTEQTKATSNVTTEQKLAAPKKSGLELSHLGSKKALVTPNNLAYLPKYTNKLSYFRFEKILNGIQADQQKILADTTMSTADKRKALAELAKADRTLRNKFKGQGYDKIKSRIKTREFPWGMGETEIIRDSSITVGEGKAGSNIPLKTASKEEKIKIIEAGKENLEKAKIRYKNEPEGSAFRKAMDTRVNCADGCFLKVANKNPEKVAKLFASGQITTADKVPQPEKSILRDEFKEANVRWNNDVGAFETPNGDVATQQDLKLYAEENPMEVKVGEEPPKVNKSVLKTVGKTLAKVGAPLPTALLDSYFIGQQVKDGKSTEEIAKDPLNWVGLAAMEPLSKVSGIAESGGLNKALRLGLNPATIRGISRFAGLPGLAISTAMTAYDQYKKYQNEEGFVYNLFNKEGN